MNLSVCMIVKNEEAVLRKSLESIKDVADEIIIADTGSSDKTIEIAKQFTGKIYHFKWIDDFSAAMNFSVSHATLPFVCRWDADFVLKKENIRDLNELKKRNFDNADVASFTWNIAFGDDNSPVSSINRWFIFKKNKFHFESRIHSDIVPNKKSSPVVRKSYPFVEVDHLKDKIEKSYRYKQTLSIARSMLAADPFNKRILFTYGEELIFDKKFAQAIEVFEQYLILEKEDDEKIIFALENLVLCYLSLGKKRDLAELLNNYSGEYIKDPRFLLSYADVTALFNFKEAEKFYLNYILNPVTPTTTYLYDYERHFIHPHFMLSQIYYQLKNFNKSYEHINIVIENTRFNKRRYKAMSFLERVKHNENKS